jgi:hypothetical protein
MRRHPRLSSKTNAKPKPSKRRDANIPTVPTFQPTVNTVAAPPPSVTAIEDDAAEDAVRRMVEAAYT